ncbi:MAG TPA: lipoprotein signal peptidase [Bacteroidales bacterium]|nr:lipoprotein signal peptidase [Bacteroidales bacterium]
MKKKTLIALAIITGVLVLDQIIKIWVKTNMVMGEEIHIIGDKIMFHFTENAGMGFGMQFGGLNGKIALSIFRIIAIAGLSYYLYRIIKSGENLFYVICISLVIAGATGNLLDSALYGLIFDKGLVYDPRIEDWVAYSGLAQFSEDGYSGFLTGCVVDMFYCPVIDSHYPDWFPIVGGKPFLFFRPVFNVADSAITISVFLMIIFYKKIFRKKTEENKNEKEQAEVQSEK